MQERFGEGKSSEAGDEAGIRFRLLVNASGCISGAWVIPVLSLVHVLSTLRGEHAGPSPAVVFASSAFLAITGEAVGVYYFAKHRGSRYESATILLVMLLGLLPLFGVVGLLP